MDKTLIYIILISVTAFLLIPKNKAMRPVQRYFQHIYTFYHEFGHALMTLVMGGKNKGIKLFHDTSGVATFEHRNRFSRVLVFLAGYPFGSGVAFGLFYLLVHGHTNAAYWLIVATMGIGFVLWMRNLFGFLWMLSFLAVLTAFYFYMEAYLLVGLFVFTSLVLVEGMKASVNIFVMSVRTPRDAGDTTQLRKETMVSARVWGLVFLLITGYITFEALSLLQLW